jgi:hypothetical protein
MKTKEEIQARIKEVEQSYSHVLTGTTATVFENAPRALMQLEAQTKLTALNWALGKTYKSKLKKSPHS